jgi:hypothetical protein
MERLERMLTMVYVVRMVKSERVRWAWNATCTDEMINLYKTA